ncbi:MAG TPA: hypothetical protein VM759_04905 [Longimicrobium sp.]|nr:hypothetical protein [Longimicrobium sp.]
MPLRPFVFLLPVLMAACAPASGPRVVNNPCDEPSYRALKARSVDSLSKREYEQLQRGDAACANMTQLLAASASAEPRRPPPRLDTDAHTQAMQSELGSEIFIRNRGTVPIIVTSVTLHSCVAVADVCGTQYPRTRINPGDVRRVMRVRYQAESVNASFQYTYRVEPADLAQN